MIIFELVLFGCGMKLEVFQALDYKYAWVAFNFVIGLKQHAWNLVVINVQRNTYGLLPKHPVPWEIGLTLFNRQVFSWRQKDKVITNES